MMHLTATRAWLKKNYRKGIAYDKDRRDAGISGKSNKNV